MDATFDLDLPSGLEEALRLLGGEGAMPLAGGTNVIVDIRAGRARPKRLVSLSRLAGLRGIRQAADRIAVGGGTTVTDLLHSDLIARTAPSITESARLFGGQMVRNAATVAGNVASGSPAADLIPPLLSLDAEVTLVSMRGRRTMPLHELFTDYRKDLRAADELIEEISWPAPARRSSTSFYKLARRKGDAITITGVAVTVTAEAGRCTRARIALGAVAPIVLRARDAEKALEGQSLTPALIDHAARTAADQSRPIDDIRASAEYRRHAVHVLTRRLVTEAWQRLN
jgi:carbon-monoxide dehydrogenase medium subunit